MNRIKTKLKFKKSDRSGSWVGFVSINTKSGRMRGVSEDSKEPKRVCVVRHELAPIIEPDILYDVMLIPMKDEDSGYIVVEAEPHAFDAVISSNIVKNALYRIEIKFGNKIIFFDPKDGRKDSVRTIEGVCKVLRYRKDIKNILQVIEDFRKKANILMAFYENDGNYNGTRK